MTDRSDQRNCFFRVHCGGMTQRTKKVVEDGARRVRLRTNIQHVLLHTIATAGILSVALLMPNAFRVLAMFDGGKKRLQNPKYLFGTAFEKLLLKKMIVLEQGKNGKLVRLTKEGEQALAFMVAHKPDSREHRSWDGRFRMVTYDIHESRKKVRVRLKELLCAFGFYKLQNSVWVYPYDCEALIIMLKADFKIGAEVLYAVVEKIENDKKLKEHFGLR